MAQWIIRGDKAGKRVEEFLCLGSVGVDFYTATENLSGLNRDEIRAIIERDGPWEPGSGEVTKALKQIWNFVRVIDQGDEVLMPKRGGGQVHVGLAVGPYHWIQGTDLPQRRDIEWTDIIRPYPSSVSKYDHRTIILVKV